MPRTERETVHWGEIMLEGNQAEVGAFTETRSIITDAGAAGSLGINRSIIIIGIEFSPLNRFLPRNVHVYKNAGNSLLSSSTLSALNII